MRFFILPFQIRAHGAFKKLLDIQMIFEQIKSTKHFVILSKCIFMDRVPE